MSDDRIVLTEDQVDEFTEKVWGLIADLDSELVKFVNLCSGTKESQIPVAASVAQQKTREAWHWISDVAFLAKRYTPEMQERITQAGVNRQGLKVVVGGKDA